MRYFHLFSIGSALLFFSACDTKTSSDNQDSTTDKPNAPRIKPPDFSADSAYAHVKTQVAFGPRVPGSKAHAACAQWLADKLKTYNLIVTPQKAPIALPNGSQAELNNVFAAFKPERSERILLIAHWDSRAMADRDTARFSEPIDGANDGASGVGVLFEIARLLQQKDPNIGVDFLLVDAEDQGESDRGETSWCIGAQYWANNKPAAYKARFGILLDMVGGRNPIFPREGTSMYYAESIVRKVWSAAAGLGYGSIFVNETTGRTVDDHAFVNPVGIPTIDIVHYDPAENDYFPHHHRHSDSLSNIDPATLKIVGSVVLDVIYNEIPSIDSTH
jgi:hypothetical protein